MENILKVLRDYTAGEPMREDVKWTNLSRRQISRRLTELGTPAGKIEKTETTTGLKVAEQIMEKVSETDRRDAHDFQHTMTNQ